MRFALAHKASTYIMAVCAYFALALSGFLSDLWILLSLLGLVASWWWEPPRIDYDRYGKAWTIGSVLVALYAGATVLGGRDILLVGAEFLMYLLVVKLFNRRSCRDYQQVYVLSFLMLVAGTVLNTEITYGAFFLGYVVASTWALILFHLRREMEDNFLLKHSDGRPSQRVEVTRILNSRRIVGGKFFLGTSLVSLGIFAFATMLFLFIPRIGFGFFFQKDRHGLHMAGFSDGVQLGAHGVIKDNRTVVMRVKVDGGYQGSDAPAIHWRGVAFDQYEKGTWSRTLNAPISRRRVMYPDRVPVHHMLYDKPADELVPPRPTGVRQEIYLEPMGNDVLFGAAMPTAFEFDSLPGRTKPRQGRNDELRLTHTQGIKYEVYSRIEKPSADELRAATSAFLPEGFDVYTQYPEDEITARTIALAETITAGHANSYDKARAIEAWLRTNLAYTLEMRSPGDLEPIDFFLFERRRGHCEYFSSAMTILLRVLDIPARNVNGFLGGEWNEYDDYIAVRAGDAHSWVEVYFPGKGWVTFDPTPAGGRDRLGRGGGGVLDKVRRFFDNMRFKWFKWVVEYDIYQQLSIFKAIGQKLKGGTKGARSLIGGFKDWANRNKAAAIATGLIFVALLVGISLLRRRRRARGGSSASGARRGKRAELPALYNGVLDYLKKRGHARPTSRTPREHARALAAADAPGATELGELTEIYYAAEYGAPADDAALARARVLSDLIRTAFAQARKRPRAAA